MLGRKAHRNAEALRLPEAKAIGERALRRDLGGPALSVCVEDRGKEHGSIADRHLRRQRPEPLALQERERRDEIEIPVGDHSRTPARARRSRIAASTARFASASRALHAAISSSVRQQPMQNPLAASITHTLMQGEATSSAGATAATVSLGMPARPQDAPRRGLVFRY